VASVACLLCHLNLHARQRQIEEKSKEEFSLPMMGLAFGLAAEALGFDQHFVDPIPTLKRFKEIL
jgi:heterodisulfide reductase subunit B